MKTDLEQVDVNATHMDYDERSQLLCLLKKLEEFSDSTLGEWYTDPIDLELNPDCKPFDVKNYPFPRVHKENFHNYLQR